MLHCPGQRPTCIVKHVGTAYGKRGPSDNSVSQAYTQSYDYDKLGNIQSLQHVASGGNFTRSFDYVTDKNKLNTISSGLTTYSFTHDVNGNITEEDTSRHFNYDYADRLKSFHIQASTETPSIYTQYFYDAGGNRTKKITRTQDGGIRTTVYIDGIFEHSTESGSGSAIPNLTIGVWTIGDYGGDGAQNVLHIMDGSSRVATRRIGDDFGDATPEIKYNLEDHLGSSTLLLDTEGVLVSSEEYYPFGETSFGSFAKKRYRFCGKEKDEESGLYYYGLRYYNPWTCRFLSVDPMSYITPGISPYCYANCTPIKMNDPTGAKAEDAPKTISGENINPPLSNVSGGKNQRRIDRAKKRLEDGKESKWSMITGEKLDKIDRQKQKVRYDADKTEQKYKNAFGKNIHDPMGQRGEKKSDNSIEIVDQGKIVATQELKKIGHSNNNKVSNDNSIIVNTSTFQGHLPPNYSGTTTIAQGGSIISKYSYNENDVKKGGISVSGGLNEDTVSYSISNPNSKGDFSVNVTPTAEFVNRSIERIENNDGELLKIVFTPDDSLSNKNIHYTVKIEISYKIYTYKGKTYYQIGKGRPKEGNLNNIKNDLKKYGWKF